MNESTLKNYVVRYKMNKDLLAKHPNDEILKRKIAENEHDIIKLVTSE